MGRAKSLTRYLVLGTVLFASAGAIRAQDLALPPVAAAQSPSAAKVKAKTAAPRRAHASASAQKPAAPPAAMPPAAAAASAEADWCTLATPRAFGESCVMLSASGSFDPGRSTVLPGGSAWVRFGYSGNLTNRIGGANYYQLGFDDIAGHPAADFEAGYDFLFDLRTRPDRPTRSHLLLPFVEVGIGDRTGAPFHAYFPVGAGAYWATSHGAMPFVEFREVIPLGHTSWPAMPQIVVGFSWGIPD